MQLVNSNEIVKLSRTVSSLHNLSEDASRTSAKLLDMVNLLRDMQIAESTINSLVSDVDILSCQARGMQISVTRAIACAEHR